MSVEAESVRGNGNAESRVDVLDIADAKSSVRVLIIDDEATLRESCASVLELQGFDVTVAARGDDARDMLQRRMFDIAMIDLYMSRVSGMELLKICLERNPEALVIVMTGNPSVESSLEALRAGAWDYLPKPFSAPQLQTLLGRAAHTVIVGRESRSLDAEVRKRHGHSDKVELLGDSVAFRRAVELARKVAATDASVFITGESGSGKEMFAQFIHHHSRRSSRPFVALNCAALPEGLLESEMFGHVKGSFTGAVQDKQGLLETANGGTMFMDELTEMAAPMQAKLLRVIQDGTIRRVGSARATDAVVNVRFVAATNRDAQKAVEAGDLRQDLFYRLRVVPIHVPALRDRVDDVPILASHFLTRFWKRHRGRADRLPTFSEEALASLQARPWPGNVRELQNVIEHAVVLLEPGTTIRPEDIPDLDGAGDASASVSSSVSLLPREEKYHAAREQLLAQFERQYLTWLVRRANGNMSRAARIANVDRTTLYRLMEKHELQKQDLRSTMDG